MVQKISAGLLMYRIENDGPRYFLIHPGGPFWKNKDIGCWGIPKGELDHDYEDLLDVAKREFFEETGIIPPENNDSYNSLGTIRQKNGKTVYAWGFLLKGPYKFECKSFAKVVWPPYSGKIIEVPEADKGEFFSFDEAKKKILETQFELIERLNDKIKSERGKQISLGAF